MLLTMQEIGELIPADFVTSSIVIPSVLYLHTASWHDMFLTEQWSQMSLPDREGARFTYGNGTGEVIRDSIFSHCTMAGIVLDRFKPISVST
jgi:hypothetical protein